MEDQPADSLLKNFPNHLLDCNQTCMFNGKPFCFSLTSAQPTFNCLVLKLCNIGTVLNCYVSSVGCSLPKHSGRFHVFGGGGMNYILFYILRAHFNARRVYILLFSLSLKSFPITCKNCASLTFFILIQTAGVYSYRPKYLLYSVFLCALW